MCKGLITLYILITFVACASTGLKRNLSWNFQSVTKFLFCPDGFGGIFPFLPPIPSLNKGKHKLLKNVRIPFPDEDFLIKWRGRTWAPLSIRQLRYSSPDWLIRKYFPISIELAQMGLFGHAQFEFYWVEYTIIIVPAGTITQPDKIQIANRL